MGPIERRVIPVTPLRELYEWLRFPLRYLGNDARDKALAEAYLAKPKALESLFLESLNDFQAYDNQNEPFSLRKTSERFDKSTRNGTVSVVQSIRKAGKIEFVNGTQSREFRFVDREVGTLRSTRKTGPWLFSDGRSAANPGLGGIDALMAYRRKSGCQLPVVGEIKVGSDATPFLALIQALTYAIELATPNQQKRLLRYYSNDFTKLPDTSNVGLLLLMIESPLRQKPIRDATSLLIAKLYKSPKFAKVVTSIVVADATMKGGSLQVTSVEEFGRSE